MITPNIISNAPSGIPFHLPRCRDITDGCFHRPVTATYPQGSRPGNPVAGFMLYHHISEIPVIFKARPRHENVHFLLQPFLPMTWVVLVWLWWHLSGTCWIWSSDQFNGWVFYHISWLGNFFLKFYVYGYLCITGHGARGSRKRAWGLLELELQMVVNYYVDAENRTCVLWKSIQCS